MQIIQKPLKSGQFVEVKTKKTAIIIHHTAGSHRPDLVVDWWNGNRERVGTHYVIGGRSTTNNDGGYDGEIIQCINEDFYAYALGVQNHDLEKCSIQIELCNYGYVVPKLLPNGATEYISYVNKRINPKEVVDLGYIWRGYRYWHKYTEKQIESLRWLVNDICERHEIKKNELDFEFNADLLGKKEIKGIYTHVNFRKDKTDCSPQGGLIELF